MSKAPVFSYKAAQVKAIAESSIRELEAKLRAVTAIPASGRTFENTVAAFETAVSDFSQAVTIPTMLAYVSADADLRKASQELELKISRYSVDLFTREDLFRALNEYAAKKEKLGVTDARLLDKTLLGFKRNGLGLKPAARARVKKLMKELIGLELKFSQNLRDSVGTLEVTPAELEGLPEDYKARLKRTPAGKFCITSNYPDYLPFMDNAASSDARRRLELMYNARCVPGNIKLMERAIALRHRIAVLLGYKTFADYALADNMAGSAKKVFAFLDRVRAKLAKKGEKELAQFLKLRGGKDKTFRSWDWRYTANQLRKTAYSVDHEAIKEYFPVETVVRGMFEVFGELFGARFVPAKLPVWHPDVRAYEVKNADGAVAAYFYFDLFPREGKYKHAACFGLRAGRELADGSYQLPAAAIVSNFPPPSGKNPPLLRFDDVVTLFHEFGHVTHKIFTRSKYAKFSGTSVSMDFVEVPSKMLENWAYDPAVLRRISGHYRRPAEKLPAPLIRKIIAAKNMDSGLSYLRQVFLSVVDMKYHVSGAKVDTTKMYAALRRKISLIPLSPGNYPQANFGHLMGGYEAGYYSYLWSEVIAQDLFGAFEKAGVMNKKLGAKYRELVLAPGRSFDEGGQVRKFLGRDARESAFLRSVGA